MWKRLRNPYTLHRQRSFNSDLGCLFSIKLFIKRLIYLQSFPN